MHHRTVYGVNLPWLFGSYGHDLAPNERHPEWGCDFDRDGALRALEEARTLGFGAVRLWLCENAEGIVTRGGAVAGVHPALLESLAILQEGAEQFGLALYPTLLDGNSWKREGDELAREILAAPDQTARFAELVVRPVALALDPDRTVALELVNEPEVMTPSCAGTTDEPVVTWEELGRALRTLGDAAREARPGLQVTAGTMHVYLPHLWACDPRLDAVDVHVYHEDGGLPPLELLAGHAGDERIACGEVPVFAGECGLPDDREVDQRRLTHYLYNAEPNGYAGVFLWRLEEALVSTDGRRAFTEAGKDTRWTLLKELPARSGASR